MVAQVVIFASHPGQEGELITWLQGRASAIVAHVGCRNCFVIQDPSWHTLLLLMLWEDHAACQQAQSKIRAMLSQSTPKMFCFTLEDAL